MARKEIKGRDGKIRQVRMYILYVCVIYLY